VRRAHGPRARRLPEGRHVGRRTREARGSGALRGPRSVQDEHPVAVSLMRTLVLLVAALAAATVHAQTPLDDATRSDPAIEEIVHRAAAAALVGDVGTLDDTAAEMARADAARKDRSLARTGLTDDLRLFSAAHRPTRDARLSALDDLLDDDPDPIVERVAKNAIESQDDAAAADRLLSNDRHNRRATILNDAV